MARKKRDRAGTRRPQNCKEGEAESPAPAPATAGGATPPPEDEGRASDFEDEEDSAGGRPNASQSDSFQSLSQRSTESPLMSIEEVMDVSTFNLSAFTLAFRFLRSL